MKKLMIALAAVAVAAGVQASSIDWSIGSKAICDPANSSKFIGNETANLLSFSSATVADTLYTALAAGEMTVAQAISTYGIGAPATSSYAGDSKSAGNIGTQKINGLSNAPGSTGHFAIIVESGDKFILSAVKDANFYLPNDPEYGDAVEAKFSSTQFSKTADTRTGWTTAAVPEPTSAMLLLLGMAGLALRRRRA